MSFKKYKKIKTTLLSIIIIMITGFLINYNLPTVVETILKLTVGATISSKQIKFVKFGTIEAKDVVLSYKNKTIVDAPSVKISYTKNSLKKFRLSEIKVINPTVEIIRKHSFVNVVEAFSHSENSDSSKKAGVSVPIDIIKVIDADLTYIDESYSRKIIKQIENVNGYVSFNSKKGIDLDFKGNNGKENLEYKFNNLYNPVDMDIILKNIKVTPELIQYGYDSDQITKADGNFSMKLKIIDDELYGWGRLNNANVVYSDIDKKIKNVNGNILFDKNKIKIKFDYLLNKTPGIFKMNYSKENGVKVSFILKNLDYKTVELYKPLKSLNLPLNDLKFKKIDVNLIDNDVQGFMVEIDYKGNNLKKSDFSVKNIEGNLKFKNGILYLTGDNIKINIPKFKCEKNIKYKIAIDLSKEDIKFNLDSNLLVFNGEYIKNKNLLKIYQNKKLALQYDLKLKFFDYININEKHIFQDYGLKIQGKQKNNDILLKKIQLIDKFNKIVLNGSGYFDKSDFKYNLNFKTNNLIVNNILNLDYDVNLSFDGKIIGKYEKFILSGDIKDLKVKYQDIFTNMYANILIIKDENIQGKAVGELRKAKYKDFLLEGAKFDVSYLNGNIKLSNLQNNFLKLKGFLDVNKNYMELKYKIEDFNKKLVKNRDINLILNNLQGEILGKIDNPIVSARLKDGAIVTPNGKKINLDGDINLRDKILYLNRFKINQSFLTLEYNTEKNEGRFKANILEENLSKYYKNSALNYRVLSKITGSISNKLIIADSETQIDKIYFKGQRLPDVYVELNYTKDKMINLLRINSLNLKTLEEKNILQAKGKLDFLKNDIDIKIEPQSVDLKEFKDIINVDDMQGNVMIESQLKGKLENPKFYLNLSKGSYKIKDFKFNKISLKLFGNKNTLTIREFLAFYENNRIKGSGKYNFDKGEYLFNIYSKNIDLNFLNVIGGKYGVKNLKGLANIDIQISDDLQKNRGIVNFIDCEIELPKLFIKLKKLNTTLKINNRRFVIKSLEGILNGGLIESDGYVIFPTMEQINFEKNFYEKLDYKFNLKLKNISYDIKNLLNLNISSDITYSQNKVIGDIVINNGKLVGILKKEKGLIFTILNFIIDKVKLIVNKNDVVEKKFVIEKKLTNTPEFDVTAIIKKGIDIDIDNISTFAQDIHGQLFGRVHLMGKDNKIAIVGETEIQHGRFVMGNEDYVVDRAILLTDKKNGNILNLNPYLIFNISSLSTNENLEIALQGKINSLRLNITTNEGSESSSLKNLLKNDGNGNNGSIIAKLFKIIVDSQLSSTILRPVSKTIKNIFHISKFRIISDIVNQEVLVNKDGSQKQKSNIFGFGAYLEAENPIYKDEYYWILKLGIIDTSRYDIDENTNQQYSDAINKYDFKIERRYKSGWSYGIGVAKPNQKRLIKDKEKNNLNYYIDFKFEKKYNNIGDIFF